MGGTNLTLLARPPSPHAPQFGKRLAARSVREEKVIGRQCSYTGEKQANTRGQHNGVLGAFPTEKISLVKLNGQRIDGITANVQTKTIFIEDVALPIEEGDKLVRALPNGLVEMYLVLDRGYFGGTGNHGGRPSLGAIGPHYQVKVQKESSIKVAQQGTTIYNLTGANPRVNVHSIDRSFNVVTTSPTTLFEEMKRTITEQVQDAQRKTELLRCVDDLEEAKDTPAFLDRYKALMAVAADHLTLLAPFLAALAQMLHH